MTGGGQSGGDDQHYRFLIDGLFSAPSPLILLVMDASTASALALRLYQGPVPWAELPDAPLPRAEGRLLRFQTSAAVRLNAEQACALCDELATTRDWLYIEDVDQLLDSAGGTHYLAALLDAVASGQLAAVIATTRPDRVKRLRTVSLRLMGFALALEDPVGNDGFTATRLTSVVTEAHDRNDTGWLVMVRFSLTAPITPDAAFDADPAVVGAAELADTAYVVGAADGPPDGIMIGLRPEAFSVGQQAAAFATATMAARRVIGRALQAGETVKATRGIFYA